jgi:FtsH-binding integral membrane protein
MRIRYLSYLSLGVAAAFLAVATAAFPLSTVTALSFGMGIAMLVLSLGVAARYRKDVPSLVVSAGIAAVSLWTVVSSLVFSQGTVDDLAFASALAIGALSVVGLTAHELGAERVVHSLEVREGKSEHAPEGRPSAV